MKASRRAFRQDRDDVDADGFIRYRASKYDCDPCHLKPACCPTSPARKIPRLIWEGARDMARDIATTEAYVTSRRERKKVEMKFAHLKRILRLDRLRLRGSLGAKDEFLLAATAHRPVRGLDWRYDTKSIFDMLKWPFEGLYFDAANNDLWLPEWGEMPTDPAERLEILSDLVKKAPKLVPLVGHRYIPTEPHELGNPVLSIYQSDIIYYGSGLADYFEREFGSKPWPVSKPLKHIRFWSNLAERERG